MYDIIPLILIMVSLTIIIALVAKKFSLLATLNLDTVQAEKEAKFKEQIIGNKIKRNFFRWTSKFSQWLLPMLSSMGKGFAWVYKRLVDLKDNYKKEAPSHLSPAQTEIVIDKLMAEAEESYRHEDYDQAEEKLIEIIGKDSKNIKAFDILAQVYFDRKDFNEAKQTREHILKLAETLQVEDCDLAAYHYDLADIMIVLENMEGAMANIKESLAIEPNNPRYLDTKLKISIIKKDKISALEAYERIKEVNPENQKLEEWQKQIESL